jgi:hypothetical protein
MRIPDGTYVTGEVWEQQWGEGGKAYEAFSLFRDLGPLRTITQTMKDLGKGKSMGDYWAQKYAWRNRARAYDMHLDRLEQEEHEKEIRIMGRRQAKLGVAMSMLADKRLSQYSSDPSLTNSITLNETIRLAEIGTKIERTAAGQGDGDRGGNITFIIGMDNSPKWLPPALRSGSDQGSQGAVVTVPKGSNSVE